MDSTFRFFTETATLAIFDPKRLEHRVDDDADWWCLDHTQLDEFQSKVLSLVELGSDGYYQARVTDGDLTPDERDYAAQVVKDLGVEVVSGKLFIGPGECLPGGNCEFVAADAERGVLSDIESGSYRVSVFAIHWFDSPRWWNDEGHSPNNAPADYVVVLDQDARINSATPTVARFDSLPGTFLFDSSTRETGPQPGMTLTTKVRKGGGKLVLKECGPCYYRATLVDYSQVAWKDTIRFKVIAVDHATKVIIGDYIETLG